MDATADLEEYKFMFKQRLISGIILVLIAAFGLYMGGIVTFAMTLIVALIGYSEILRIYHIEKSSLAVIGYTGTILYYVALLFDLDQWTTAIIILFLIFLLGCYVVRFPKYKVDQMMAGFFGFVYVAVMMSFIYQIRELQNGGEFVVLLFLAAWGNNQLFPVFLRFFIFIYFCLTHSSFAPFFPMYLFYHTPSDYTTTITPPSAAYILLIPAVSTIIISLNPAFSRSIFFTVSARSLQLQ